MNFVRFTKSMTAFGAVLAFTTAVSRPAVAADDAPQSERPNIVFIFADDQCFQTIGSWNNAEVQTPNLDSLARRGTTFTHAYNMGSWSGAVCVASRTMLNSGRFVWNANEIWNRSEQERQEGRWWSEYLKSAGYRTYMTGKWHCKANAEKAFDVAKDIRPGMPKDTPQGYNRPLGPDDHNWSPSDPKFGGFWEGGTHWSEVVANHSEDYLTEAAGRDEPFFMYLAFNAPHDPRQSPQEYVDRYPADQIQVPENFLPVYPYAEQIGCGPKLRDARLAPFPRTPYSIQVNRQEYYAIITHMDAMIGRILKAIDDSGKADNTWIFFTADHGLACGQHGLIGKQNLYDHSVRVPFFVVGPDVEGGRKVDQPIYLQDVMPTTLELAGVEKPQHVEFQSLLPILDGQPSRYETVYGAYLDLQRSVRNDHHKLIVYPKAGVVRLYDIQADPKEMHDLAGDADSRPIVEDLFAELQRQQAAMNDPLDLSDFQF
ncbi:Arylsulfatase [Crateriforma conspicua]|uniref:Arylsulfatase n=2 Tax=Planctomycetaceae TaxID=126 RepID=A0A5C6FRN4_9PLAN|nr:sulfatase-like hydrolase/transferase [Crateriforma conspicua]TWU64944.1 Arylsulfatase [Crateriforma conspicua]